MGGGVSRLEETLWEEGSQVTKESNTSNGDSNRNNSNTSTRIADGGLDANAVHQTIDGVLPTPCYKNLELRKNHAGQREFEIVDTSTKEILYRTLSVPGTLAWFDVLKPTVCGNPLPSDYLLRIRPLDHLRRTWIVYRYHHPVFEGQQPVAKDSEAYKGLCLDDDDDDDDDDDTILLYKTACLAISWSRYVLVAARYGMPDPEDWQLDEDVHVVDESDNNQQDDEAKESNGSDEESDNAKDSEDYITPKELVQLRQEEQQRESPGGGVEESKTDESDRDDTENDNDNCNDNCNDNGNDDENEKHSLSAPSNSFDSLNPRINPSNSSSSQSNQNLKRSRAQTNQLRSYFGDTPRQTKGNATHRESVTTKLASRSSSLLQSGKQRISSSFSSFRKSRDDEIPNQEEQQQQQQEKDKTVFAYKGESSSSETLPVSNKSSEIAIRQDETIEIESQTIKPVTSKATKSAEEEQEQQLVMSRKQQEQQNYEMAMQGVLDLDGDQPIVQCQEISNKMIGNHQTFNMTKEDLLTLLKLETESRRAKEDSQSPVEEQEGLESQEKVSRQSWFSKLKRLPKNESENDTTAENVPIIKEEELSETQNNNDDQSSVKGLSMKSGWNWLASTKIKGNTTEESSEQESLVISPSDPTMPSLSQSSSPSSDLDSSNGMGKLDDDDDEDGKPNYIASPPIEKHSSPGDGVEEAKEEECDREETTEIEQLNPNNNDSICKDDDEEEKHPLISYFFWKHTSMNLGKHKMHMHLARHSDLALHVVFAIVSNQVRSERNHAVFLATGIHPSWLYIDLRNPRATIS